MFLSAGSAAQNVGTVDTEGLRALLGNRSDTVCVVNFWATWCSPCVKEIGYFEELHRLDDPLLKVVLVNLDFPDQVEQRVQPFIRAHDLTAPVVNMTEMDYNKWIPLVHEDWSGAIPATLIFNAKESEFIGTEIAREELFEMIHTFNSK
ncbi:MAG: redoxin domain-containing protein [Bacteroidales bacterium]|nr:redoxin domain-containing protein [Bacteroidales bacterium]